MDVVYVDFSTAFDAVSHDILVMKLSKCGIDEWTVRWAASWLSGRAQRVVMGSAECGWRAVSGGERWGWVLALVSFNILVNGLEEGMVSTLRSMPLRQSWEEQLARRKAVLPFSKSWTGWRARQ